MTLPRSHRLLPPVSRRALARAASAANQTPDALWSAVLARAEAEGRPVEPI